MDAAEVRAALDDRPDLEPALRDCLDATEPFTFDDLACDSGTFGELVSSGLVVDSGDGYRVADPDAARAALAGETVEPQPDREFTAPSLDVDRRVAAALAGALAVVVAFRLLAAPAVFRDGVVVLSGNDPYFYRYWVEQVVTTGTGPASLPPEVATEEPLLVVTLAAVAALLGGTTGAVGWTMAWFPVVAAVVSGVLVYALARRVTGDRRVALAAVLLLAVVPVHAFRTGVGFADHHAFDYPWLGLTALALVALADPPAPREDVTATAVGWTLALAAGVAGQTLAWENGVLLLVPVGLYALARAVGEVAADRSPAVTLAPVVAGLALAAGATGAVHVAVGWHRALVAFAPALLLVGVVGVAVVGEAGHRLGRAAREVAAVEVVAGVAGVASVAVLLPGVWVTAVKRVTGSLLRGGDVAEVQSLFGNSLGWLLLFGFVLVLAVPYAAWGTARARDRAAWAVPAAYFWYFLLLAAIQVRFAGQLALFAALFAGLGFVHLAERVELAGRPRPFRDGAGGDDWTPSLPDRTTAGLLVVLFLLVGGLGMVQSGVKTSQVTIDDGQYRTAAHLADHADGEGTDYVLSRWGWNRMYNYFVNGDSRAYGYARSNYLQFLTATAPVDWYTRLSGRVEYVVTTDLDYDKRMLGARLHDAHGSRAGDVPGLAHYRAVYVAPGGTHKAFELVPGARLVGTADPNATVTVTTTQQVSGTSFTYERRVKADASGEFAVIVPYAGAYEVAGERVEVPASAVENGTQVTT